MFTQQHEGLSGRIRQVRREQFGARGVSQVARLLNVSDLTWLDFEAGSGVPAHILLDFIDLTGVSALWLMCGEGPKFRAEPARASRGPDVMEVPPFVRLYCTAN